MRADEYETVSTRTLAIERFKRNHGLMAEVFTYASQGSLSITQHISLSSNTVTGHRAPPVIVSPYASLDLSDLNQKVVSAICSSYHISFLSTDGNYKDKALC